MSTISGGIPLFTPRAGGGTGGGGAATVNWFENGLAPTYAVEYDTEVYKFDVEGSAQNLYATYRFPQSHVAGTVTTINILAYSPDTSGTILLKAEVTLIVPEAFEMGSVVYQRTTTNTAITMSAANDLEPQIISLDITDANGLIGGGDIGPGYLLKIRLFRSTDTATSEVRFIKNSAEVVFT